MTLGFDRSSELVAPRLDEGDPAVKALLHRAIAACRKQGKYVGICGQGPSDHPELARRLMEQGIDSASPNPDTEGETWLYLGEGTHRPVLRRLQPAATSTHASPADHSESGVTKPAFPARATYRSSAVTKVPRPTIACA